MLLTSVQNVAPACSASQALFHQTHNTTPNGSVSRGAAGIWAQRPFGEPQLPFLGHTKKHATNRQEAEGASEGSIATAHQHHSFSLWRRLSCMPTVGLEDKLPTEEDGHSTSPPASAKGQLRWGHCCW